MGTSINIERQNGNIPRSLEGEDHVTGLAVYLPSEDIPESFMTAPIQTLSTIEAVEKSGIIDSADYPWTIRVLNWHLSELFRVNPGVSLYLGIFIQPEDNPKFREIKSLQNYSDGRIRQIGVWCPWRELKADDIVTLQGIADALDLENAPLSVVYAPKIKDIGTLPTDIAGGGKCRVSVSIGQPGSGTGADLYASEDNSDRDSVGAIGIVLGLISRAKVHQCIAWVREFPTGVTMPAFADGTLYRDVDKAFIEQLDAARYLFFVTQTGQSGSYMNDSHNMDSAISDYSNIESVRTMDKAVRGIRSYLIPELGGNIYIDSSSGKMASYSVAHLETVAGKALEDMERAGELSGYKVEIDPEQDVLSSGTVEIVIRNVAVAVMRKINVKIGFTKSV